MRKTIVDPSVGQFFPKLSRSCADNKEKPSGEPCVACTKKAKEFAYAARQY